MTETRRDTIPEHDFVAHEHRELTRGIDRIGEVAALRGTTGELSFAVLEVLRWMEDVLDPHAEWEDRWLYPAVDRRARTPWATKLMSFEHHQIREAAHALATVRTKLHDGPSSELVLAVRGRLFALEAILRAHLAREERFLIPLLDASGGGTDPSLIEPATNVEQPV